MDSKSLMIGDWVKINTHLCGDEIRYDKVIELGKYIDYGIPVFFIRTNTYRGIESIEPIPLTAEILEKNIPFEWYWDSTKNNPKGSVTEWRKDTDEATIFVRDFRDQKGEYIVEIHIKGCANYGVKQKIYNVHELQHALRLCGLNELADNFKI